MKTEIIAKSAMLICRLVNLEARGSVIALKHFRKQRFATEQQAHNQLFLLHRTGACQLLREIMVHPE